MKSVDQIIEAAGGGEAVARALAISPAALRKWRQFGAAPARHQLSLIRLSRGALTVDDFAAAEQRNSVPHCPPEASAA